MVDRWWGSGAQKTNTSLHCESGDLLDVEQLGRRRSVACIAGASGAVGIVDERLCADRCRCPAIPAVDPGRGDDGALTTGVGVHRGADASNPRIGAPGGRFERDCDRNLVVDRGRLDAIVPGINVGGADAVGFGKPDPIIGSANDMLSRASARSVSITSESHEPAWASPSRPSRITRTPTPRLSATVSDSTSPS